VIKTICLLVSEMECRIGDGMEVILMENSLYCIGGELIKYVAGRTFIFTLRTVVSLKPTGSRVEIRTFCVPVSPLFIADDNAGSY